MLDKILSFLAGNQNEKILKSYRLYVERINSLEAQMLSLSDFELQQKTAEFKQIIQNKINSTPFEILISADVPKMPGQLRTSHDKALKEVLDQLLPEAFAVCREVSRRVLNMRHFDVQLIGGIQLHNCGIAEMQTGEGKTLVCTLPAYLNALSGRGVHIITVNDYLATRDSEWMGEIYKFLGLSVGLIIHSKKASERQAAYNSDICYGTNNEFGFDYLRDNMETDLDDCVQRPYYMAIVDEVDSILIDEARTPLIISGMPDAQKNEVYVAMAKLSLELKKSKHEKDTSENAHYHVDEKAKNIILTDAGIKRAETLLKVKDLWAPESNLAHYLIQALRAKELFTKDTDYVVKTNPESKKKEIIIVDEFTGRLMEGRRWGDGLHQAVEAKEKVSIQDETLTLASITFQNLFRLYPKLAGMTGTAATEAEEFGKIYNLEVLSIPTNKPCIRKDLNDVVLKTERAKSFAIIEDIISAHQINRPVLVGTTSIEKSELLASFLSKPLMAMKALQERLSRLLNLLDKKSIFSKIALQKANFRNELNKLLDRPGNLSYESFKEYEGEIRSQIASDEDLSFALNSVIKILQVLDAIRKGLNVNVLNAKHHEKEASIIRQAGRLGAITIATNMAGRGTDIVLGGFLSNEPQHSDYNKVDLEAQKIVIEAGGLHVIGTERHESRRIDNQLRGRCARQGDPGSSRFYLSLEDNLMRIFGGERIMSIMDMLKADEDMPIEASIISGAINNSQKKVEAHNFDIRKHVLQYDDVINTQREVIYRERREILEGADIHSNILEIVDEHISKVLYSHVNPNTPSELWFDDSKGVSPMKGIFATLKSNFGELALKDLYYEDFKNSSFDFIEKQVRDSIRSFFENKEQECTPEIFREAERQIMLHVIDSKWVEHLHAMDNLRDGIQLRSYGQKDPLIEYKKEAFDMFETLLENIKKDTVILLAHAQILKQASIKASPVR
jgi:preprotein translocase subunit SecA